MKGLIRNLDVAVPDISLDHVSDHALVVLGESVKSLLNIAGVTTGRATHYNTKEEKEEAEARVHRAVFSIDRGIYGCIFCLPGVTDYSIQRAVASLLRNAWVGGDHEPQTKSGVQTRSVLSFRQEGALIQHLVSNLPANRMLNLFLQLKGNRVNNSRTKKALILPTILNSRNLELWSVKYRHKVRKALEHAWDTRRTGIVCSILGKKSKFSGGVSFMEVKESGILNTLIDRYLEAGTDRHKVYECISFVLGNDHEWTLPLFQSFYKAREDLKAGAGLPKEVLEGIRSVYHSKVSKDEILKLSKDTLTKKQRKNVQRKAKEAGVEVEWNPMDHSAVDLYLYAFEMGLNRDIEGALAIKAEKASKQLPIQFRKLGILVDGSYSMIGDYTQKLRPMSIALAMKDVLEKVSTECEVFITGSGAGDSKLCLPGGPTDLATGLVELLQGEPDTVFVISDGYENSPAGRVHEVMSVVRELGIKIPVYHVNPVVSADTKKGLKSLSDLIPVIPLSRPEALSLTLFTAMLDVDVRRGISALVGMALPVLRISQ